jgi:tRNA threonylcarbamoyladenosine biosynthesis protein TsaB
MLVLAIDTSSQVGSVAALRDTELLGVVSSDSEETHSTRLFRELKTLLKAHHLDMPAFDLYAVAAGPGSFTGVRVGLTAVKGWAEVYGKPVVAVSALEAVAAQAPDFVPLVASVIDARRGQIYAGVYESACGERRRRGEDVVMPPGECFDYLRSQVGGEPVVFATPSSEWFGKLLAESPFHGAKIEAVSAVLAPAIGRIGLERARRGEAVEAASLDAHYVRRSDAELLWKAQ